MGTIIFKDFLCNYSCDLELSWVVRGLDTIVVPVFTRLFLRHKNVSADNIFLFTKKAASLLVRLPIFAAEDRLNVGTTPFFSV